MSGSVLRQGPSSAISLPGAADGGSTPTGSFRDSRPVPTIPDHEPLKCIGRGSYGEVWLARNIMGVYRAVKVVYHSTFDSERPYDREFEGLKKFEPVSRTHESQLAILHVGRNDRDGYFYHVMELADDANAEYGVQSAECGKPEPGVESLDGESRKQKPDKAL